MQWKQVKDEIPPTDEYILLGYKSGENSFSWVQCKVKRPYDQDIKYNENYYTYRIEYCEHEWPLPIHFYWAEVEEPTFFVEEQ